MKHVWAVLVAGSMFASCGDGKKEAADRLAAEADSLAALGTFIDLEVHGFPLELQTPDAQLLQGAEPVVAFNENTGKLEVRAGEHFALTVVEESGDMGRVKADLDREQVRTNTIISETPEMLVYKSEFPDDPSLVFVHFYRIVPAAGRSFVVEDIQDGNAFNAQDIERMVAAIRAKLPA